MARKATDPTPEGMVRCGRCRAARLIESYALKPNGTRMKTCTECRERRIRLDSGAVRSQEKNQVGVLMMGEDPRYLEYLKLPWEEIFEKVAESSCNTVENV